MKHRRLILALTIILPTMAAMPGCIRTTHKIKPIHITMDINLKVDRALDDFFGDIDSAPSTPQAPKAKDETAAPAAATNSTESAETAVKDAAPATETK